MDRRLTDCTPRDSEAIESVRPRMPAREILHRLTDFYKVMGDSTRLQILWALDEKEMCVGDLAVLLNMTKSAISHQLGVLREAKLIRCRREGKQVIYALDDGHVRLILETTMDHV